MWRCGCGTRPRSASPHGAFGFGQHSPCPGASWLRGGTQRGGTAQPPAAGPLLPLQPRLERGRKWAGKGYWSECPSGLGVGEMSWWPWASLQHQLPVYSCLPPTSWAGGPVQRDVGLSGPTALQPRLSARPDPFCGACRGGLSSAGRWPADRAGSVVSLAGAACTAGAGARHAGKLHVAAVFKPA